MITVDRQVHGYRQGHQLLGTSLLLSKEDQSIVDRLSDVAGPLRPKEAFLPYLSGYPLPSGDWYVLARTWQDLTVSRAGCVRTLSLIIPAKEWAAAQNIDALFGLLKLPLLPAETEAVRSEIPSGRLQPLLPVDDPCSYELLEALFLEEQRSVAVFDASKPELMAERLLTALWPTMRRQFSVSTFALSPRKVGGRDFDLMFVPWDARSKFADWSGRRVDGRAKRDARHRWTSAIASRVFEDPYPTLLTDRDLNSIVATRTPDHAALRIALLWEELLMKVKTTPTAALGLIDIANSGFVRSSLAGAVEPELISAIWRALVNLPENDAWDFLGAVARKLRGEPSASSTAVNEAVRTLAKSSPRGAIELLQEEDPSRTLGKLLPQISAGIAEAPIGEAEQALMAAPGGVLGRLAAHGGALRARIAQSAPLLDRLASEVPTMDRPLLDAMASGFLPLLVEDWQLPVAAPLLATLDNKGLSEEVRRLGRANDFSASNLIDLILERAQSDAERTAVKNGLVSAPPTERRDLLLQKAMRPDVKDVSWLLFDSGLSHDNSTDLLVKLLQRASNEELRQVLTNPKIQTNLIQNSDVWSHEVICRALHAGAPPAASLVDILRAALFRASDLEKFQLAEAGLMPCLKTHFGGDEITLLITLLEAIGDQLNGPAVVAQSLSLQVIPSIAARNLVAFSKAQGAAKGELLSSASDVVEAIIGRRVFDLGEEAATALARFMDEAVCSSSSHAIRAVATLLPYVMRQTQQPVSSIVAVTFPVVYRELASNSDVPDYIRFMPFYGWDRCKAARNALVSAFLNSKWKPRDLAEAACRCGDVAKILRRVAKLFGGETYLEQILAASIDLPASCRLSIQVEAAKIRLSNEY
ncbi:GAP1-N1 domain-containing protein [Dyella sp.]|uniref:GAP1-N1 domain-containing protein n=1 Tax=Dyella sp. TaxID=1869338 RepID=UPI003F7D05F3